MNKEFEVVQNEESVELKFNNQAMPEYFIHWFEAVGKELFEAALIDVNE